MANSRISDLSKKQVLLSNGLDQVADDDALFIMAREKSHNESVAYKDLKTSINDYNVLITGDQNITGEKSFYDNAFFKKDVRIDGDLTVQGDVFNLQFRDSSGQDLDQYLTNLDSNLSVVGNAELLSDAIVSQKFTTVGDTELQGDALLKSNLDVEKESTFQGDSAFKSDIEIVGNQNLSGLLTVHDNAEFKKNVLVGKDLTVQGDVFNIKFEDASGNTLDSYITDFDSNLRVKGESTLDKNLTAKQDVTILGNESLSGTLDVAENGLFQKDLKVLGELSVTGLSTQTLLSVKSDATFEEIVTVKNSGVFESDLDVLQDTRLKKTDIDGTLKVLGQGVFDQDVSVAGDQDLAGNLTVHDNAEFKKDVLVGNNLTVRGDLFNIKFNDGAGGDADQYLTDFDSNLKIKGELGISGDALFNSAVDVAGATTLSNTLDVSQKTILGDDLDVTGNADLKSTLSVAGATALADTLDVTNKTTLASLDVNGSAALLDTLDVTKKTTLASDLDVTGNTDLKSTLSVAGATALADALDVTKKTTLSDALDVLGDTKLKKTDIDGKLTVVGQEARFTVDQVIFEQDVSVQGDLSVKGDLFNVKFDDGAGGNADQYLTDFDSNLQVKGDLGVIGDSALSAKLSVGDTLAVTKKTTLSDALDVLGAADLQLTLDVAGATALADSLSVAKDASFDDNLSIKNVLQLGPRSGIGSGYFNLYQDDPASDPGDGQFLSFKHKDQPDTGAVGGLFLSEDGKTSINTYDSAAMLNIEQPSSELGLKISSQPSESAAIHLQELGQTSYLELGSGKLSDTSIPGVTPLATLYGERATYLQSNAQDLAIFAATDGTNVHVGAGNKKLLTFTGTTDSHPVSGTEAGNDVIFGADSNVGINVAEVALSPVTQDKFKLHVDGEVKIDGRLFATDVFETYPVIPKVGDLHMGATVARPQNVWDAGDQGTLFFDDDFVFICVRDSDGTDPNRIAWKRFAISEW